MRERLAQVIQKVEQDMNPKQYLFGITTVAMLLLPAAASADVFLFSDATAFANALAPDLVVSFVEDFEESTIAPGTADAFIGPLLPGVPNENFPFGLSAPNMGLDVIDPGFPPSNDLVVLGDGVLGLSSVTIGPNASATILSIDFFTPETAISMDVFDPLAAVPGDYQIDVFNSGGSNIFSGIHSTGGASGFLGIITTGTDNIGEIRIDALDGATPGSSELIDNVTFYSVSVVPGDANDDGSLDNLDIAWFVLALTNVKAYQTMFPDVDPDQQLDMDGSGAFDNLDIAGFVAALTGG